MSFTWEKSEREEVRQRRRQARRRSRKSKVIEGHKANKPWNLSQNYHLLLAIPSVEYVQISVTNSRNRHQLTVRAAAAAVCTFSTFVRAFHSFGQFLVLSPHHRSTSTALTPIDFNAMAIIFIPSCYLQPISYSSCHRFVHASRRYFRPDTSVWFIILNQSILILYRSIKLISFLTRSPMIYANLIFKH